jgi:hypothetical protein
MYTPAARETFHTEFPGAILCLRKSIGPPPACVNLGSPRPRSDGVRDESAELSHLRAPDRQSLMLGTAVATCSIFRLAFHSEKVYGARSSDVLPQRRPRHAPTRGKRRVGGANSESSGYRGQRVAALFKFPTFDPGE